MRNVMNSRLTLWGVPIAVGILAFAFRVLAASGLTNDHYMTLGWAQQVLFGEWPERDFVEPGMPLSYLLSAAVQYFWPGPYSELLLTAGMLAAAAAVTVVVAKRLSGFWTIGVFAALLELAFFPRFYSFPKILTPAVAIFLLQSYARVPSRRHLMWLGAWTAVSALFRHDLGVYVACAVVVGLVVMHYGQRQALLRALTGVVAGGSMLFVPYAVYVQWAVGWPEHLRRGFEFSKSDAHQIFSGLPRVADLAQWNRDGTVAFLFFSTHALLVLALITLVWRRQQHSREERGVAAAVATALAMFIPVILREPIDGRLADLAGVIALMLAWLLGEGLTAARESRRAGRVATARVLVVGVVLVAGLIARNVWILTRVDEQIDNTGIYAGARGVNETWTDLRTAGMVWPWARAWPTHELPGAVPYLAACTAPTDAVLLTWPAPEYNFFARRRFAAGHVEFLPPSAFTTDSDQQQMRGWLDRQTVPVILTNQDRYEEFVRAYPEVASYLSSRYRSFAQFTIYDGSTIVLSSRSDLTPTRTWGPEKWPCGFQ